jgi:hypothetical protein
MSRFVIWTTLVLWDIDELVVGTPEDTPERQKAHIATVHVCGPIYAENEILAIRRNTSTLRDIMGFFPTMSGSPDQ